MCVEEIRVKGVTLKGKALARVRAFLRVLPTSYRPWVKEEKEND